MAVSVNCLILLLLRTTLGRRPQPWRRWSRWRERSRMAWLISTPTSLCTGTSPPGTAWWPRTSQSKLEVGCPDPYTAHRTSWKSSVLQAYLFIYLLIDLFICNWALVYMSAEWNKVPCEDLLWFKTCELLPLSWNLWNTSACCCSSEAAVQHVGLKRAGEAVI